MEGKQITLFLMKPFDSNPWNFGKCVYESEKKSILVAQNYLSFEVLSKSVNKKRKFNINLLISYGQELVPST